MLTSLLSMYEQGAITADHLACTCLETIDPDDPGTVLGGLLGWVVERILAFSVTFQSRGMQSTYGTLPLPERVEAARNWIESHGGVKARPEAY